MATPKRTWFKVPDSVYRDEMSNDTLATLVRLQAYMHERWVRDDHRGCPSTVVIGPKAAMTITGKSRPHLALQALLKLPSSAGLGGAEARLVSSQGVSSVVFDWPKCASFQGWEPRKLPEKPLSENENENENEKKTGAHAPRVRAVGRVKAQPPEWSLEAARLLRAAVTRRWPGTLPPTDVTPWARELARIAAGEDAVRGLIAWYCAPARDGLDGLGIAKYTPEVRSGRTLREKWDQLVAARVRGERGDSAAQPQRVTMRVPETFAPTREPGVDYEAERKKIREIIESKRGRPTQ